MIHEVPVKNITVGGDVLTITAGPCVLDTLDEAMSIAFEMKKYCAEFGFNYIFKASFDKANRTSITSYRGPGIERGLEWLAEIGRAADVPVVTDIHEPHQAEAAARYVDMLQIPAFLCRQTDLLIAASRAVCSPEHKTAKALNIKKAQFMAPEDMASVIGKCREAGCDNIILCERGTSFGYHALTVDFRSLPVMRALGVPVMFDATHSVQKPSAAGAGSTGACSGGNREFVLPLARAAAAVGADSIFMEVHPNPDAAKCDGPNSVPISRVRELLRHIYEIDKTVRNSIGFTSLDWAK